MEGQTMPLEIEPRHTSMSTPYWYLECFRSALRRVSVLLNSCPPYQRSAGVDLQQSDAALDALFAQRGWDQDLIQFNVALADPQTEGDEYSAEYFFYCDIDFPSRGSDRVAKFVVPTPFLEWGYLRLHPPRGSPQELGLHDFGGDIHAPDFVRHCATNYLVKNFWHNFTHRAIQGIATHNYHQFQGPAREDSDFEADNISNILLVRSYGLPVHSRGTLGTQNAARIGALFRRNRCNLIFAERAQHRRTDRIGMSLEERWSEMEWRFCRAVANALSMRLIIRGLAVPSLRVFFNGQVRTGRKGNVVSRWRDGSVLVEIAGRRIDTGRPPYLPNDELRGQSTSGGSDTIDLTGDRLDMIRLRRAEREGEIVQIAVAAFERLMRDQVALRDSVVANMGSLAQRITVPALAQRFRR